MKLGITGFGVVGSAVYHGLEQVGNQMSYYDINHPATSINKLLLITGPRNFQSIDDSIACCVKN